MSPNSLKGNLQELHIFGVKTMVPYKLSYLSHFWFLMLSHVVLDVCVAWPGLATSQLCPVETHDVWKMDDTPLKWPNKAENDQTKPDEWRNDVIKVP